jgi:TonB family protein
MNTNPSFTRSSFQWAVVSLFLLFVGSAGAQQSSAENSNHPAAGTTTGAPQAITEPATLSEDADVQLGHAVHADDPEVPKDLRNKPVGSVISATLRTDGTFSDIMSFGQSEFDNSAIAAVRQWRYTPATLNGAPVDVGVFIIIGSIKGKVSTTVELDLAVPRKPKIPVEDRLARGELFRVVANEVTPPKEIYTPDPEYSTPARAAKYQGTILLGAVVGSDGKMADVWVVRKLGLGLDQKAIATVRQWRFEPATEAGQPVPILINIQVQFRLYWFDMTTPSSLLRPFSKFVTIELLGREVDVPENNPLLRCMQYLAPEPISYGRFCWNEDCQYCRVTYDMGGGTQERAALSCKLLVAEGMRIKEVSQEIRFCLRDWRNSK